jgi:hypothetical protein
VGVPYDSQAVSRGGALNLFLGSAGGLTPYNGIFHQNTADVEGDAESNDAFASALCTGDFDGDGFIDVAVGAWGDRAAGPLQSGAVNIIEGRPIPPLTALEGRLLTE